MAYGETTIDAKIASIDTQLATLVTTPEVDYSIGQKRVSASQKQRLLMEQRQMWEEMKTNIPSEKVRDFEYDVNQHGEDKTEYAGDK